MQKEKLLNKINIILQDSGINQFEAKRIKNSIMFELNKYDVNEKSKELAVIETESQTLIKLFIGTILTEGKSKSTAYRYEKLLNRLMADIDKPLREVTAFDVRCWLGSMQQTVSLRTCENYRSYISSFYRWMQDEEFISYNPMVRIKPIKYNEKDRKPFSSVEVDALRNSCKTKRERAELEVLLSSGVRVSELCNMKISDVNFSTMEIIIREGKGNKTRSVFIDEVAMTHLTKYLESRTDNNDSLFVSRSGEQLGTITIRRDLNSIAKDANVSNAHPHRCRRTFATNMHRRGMDIRTIQQLMGHTDINTTMEYISLSKLFIKNEYLKYA